MTRNNHVVATPANAAEFVHSTGLTMQQLLRDIQQQWGSVEWAEYHNAMRSRLNMIQPPDPELVGYCHGINLLWDQARQTAMREDRFKFGQ